MCLSVHIGCHIPLEPIKSRSGGLGITPAEQKRAHLSSFPYVYSFGQIMPDGSLACACLLLQHAEWSAQGYIVHMDQPIEENERCPFVDLRTYTETAMSAAKPVALVCDDLGNAAVPVNEDDYHQLVISPEMISSDSFLFADPVGGYPWRVFHLTVGMK